MTDAIILVLVISILAITQTWLVAMYIPWPDHLKWLRWGLPVATAVELAIFFVAPIATLVLHR